MVKRVQRIVSLPAWNMPSDPVKAVFWFFHWLLRVLVRFFWLLIILGSLYEGIANSRIDGLLNGLISAVVTTGVGLGVWLGLGIALVCANIASSISGTVAEVNHLQQKGFPPRNHFPFSAKDDNVVEGTVTDLEEERRKRRRE